MGTITPMDKPLEQTLSCNLGCEFFDLFGSELNPILTMVLELQLN